MRPCESLYSHMRARNAMVELEYKLLDVAELVKPGQVGQPARSRPMVVLRARGSPKPRFAESRVSKVWNLSQKKRYTTRN